MLQTRFLAAIAKPPARTPHQKSEKQCESEYAALVLFLALASMGNTTETKNLSFFNS